MLNRNATRHLLLVVSALLLIFIVIGYTLRKRADSVGLEPDIVDASQSAPASLSPPPAASASGSSLRPGAASTAPEGDDDLAGWIPSVRSEELALTPPVNTGSVAPTQPVSTPHSGVITGLVPASPSDAGGSASSMRPPSAESAETGGLQIPSELLDGGDASPSSSDDSSFLASLPVPGGGSLAPPESSPSSSFVPPPSSAPVQTGSSLAPPPVADSGVGLAPPPPGVDGSGSVPSPASGGSLAPPPGTGGATSAPMSYGDGGDEDEEDEILEEWGDEEPVGSGLTPPAGGGLVPPGGAPSRQLPPPPPNRPAPPLGNESASDSLRIYVVRPGDTLSSIAARELGSGSLADNIFLLNRDVIDDPDHLLVGVKIRLPYANPAEMLPGVPDQTRRPTQGLGRTHIVARGDTLSSIALQYYGSSAGWRFLFESNKHLLPNPNQLSVGMELSIPPYEQ